MLYTGINEKWDHMPDTPENQMVAPTDNVHRANSTYVPDKQTGWTYEFMYKYIPQSINEKDDVGGGYGATQRTSGRGEGGGTRVGSAGGGWVHKRFAVNMLTI